jgi:GTP-binding protein EngB required for normal cell division
MPQSLSTLVDELDALCVETAEYRDAADKVRLSRMGRGSASEGISNCREFTAGDCLRQACSALAHVRKRLAVAQGRYVIACVGLTNVGKSTLLNAIFGESMAPAWNSPCTAFPLEFVHGRTYEVSACYHDTFERRSWSCHNAAEVSGKLERLMRQNPSGFRKGLCRVEVSAPLPVLEAEVVIADTPGFGAVQFGEDEGSHEAALRQYLEDDVAQVLWVVRAGQAISGREKAFYGSVLKAICDDVVVTGAEGWDDTDRGRFEQRYAEALDNRFLTFLFASGKEGIEARDAADPEALRQSGITAIEDRIRDLGRPDVRVEMLRRRVIQVAGDLGAWLAEHWARAGVPPKERWCPYSWARFDARCGAVNPEVVADLRGAGNHG